MSTTTNPTGAATDTQVAAVDLAVAQAGSRVASVNWANSIVDNADGSWSVSLDNLSGPSGVTSLYGVGAANRTLQDTVQIIPGAGTGPTTTVIVTDAANNTETFQIAGSPNVQTTNAGTLSAGTQAAAIEIGTGAYVPEVLFGSPIANILHGHLIVIH